ncbi:hypothetical protein PHET_03982 [Paragonimus heterotremus]|uniref:PLAT domain-containing protein n=1 Tax=Paragonimus heterotremus TaxID=100268 RepID=A0A8J4WSJ7_9TREM|nr:hypothetical protein PHET_03982 [Paragonimus heterotremus]
MLERSRSRMACRDAHLSSSPSRGSPSAIWRNRSLGNACRTNRTWRILITSGQKDPETGESYLSACTSNIVLTVCGRFQTAQAVLLRDAYVETLSDMPSKSMGCEPNNQPNGHDYRSLEDGPFWPGQTDRFDVKLRNMNEIYKIRLSHDGTGPYPEWFVAEVRMRQLGIIPSYSTTSNLPGSRLTKKQRTELETLSTLGSVELVFPCMRWLSRSKADGSLTREIAAPGTQLADLRTGYSLGTKSIVLDPLELTVYGNRAPVVGYQLCVTTGQLWNAGTTAEVRVLLQGDRGDTGIRSLYNLTSASQQSFVRGQTSVFQLDAVYLGRLRRLSIWLDGEDNEETEWFLDRIVIRELMTQVQTHWSSSPSPPVHGNLMNHSPSRILGVSYFPCYQWLKPSSGLCTPTIQLLAGIGSGSLTSDLLEQRGLHEQEEVWWRMTKWKFQAGNALVFYSCVTGSPLRVVNDGRIEARKSQTERTSASHKNDLSTTEYFQPRQEPVQADGLLTNLLRTVVPSTDAKVKGNFLSLPFFHSVFIVSSSPLECQPSRTLRRRANQSIGYIPRSRSDFSVPTPLERDVERFNTKHSTSSMVRQFHSLQNQWMRLSLDEAIGLCVTDERLASTGANDENTKFRVRAQPDQWIALETVNRFADHNPIHIYIGPDGCVVSGAAGPLSLPGKLLMPHVKSHICSLFSLSCQHMAAQGTLRDQTIIWLCTSSEQTVAPMVRGKTDLTESGVQRPYDPVNEWNFELRATGSRNKDAYWRVQRIDRGVRQFEAVAWPGHYLRVTDGQVNIMGSGGSDCHFRVDRRRSKGFVQLSPLSSSATYVGMEEDGKLALFTQPNTENTRFYIEVIKSGIPKQPSDSSEKSVVLDRSMRPQNPTEPLTQLLGETIVKPLEFSKSGSSPDSSIKGVEDEDLLDQELQFFPKLIDSKDLSERDWKVSIATCSSAKNCNVLLFVYGLQANSGPILIGQSEDEKCLFRSNSTDSFMIVLDRIGAIYKIRFELTPLDNVKEVWWEISEVVLENYITGERLSFDFSGRPIGRNPNFCQLSREQAFDESASVLKTHLLYDSQDSLSAIQDVDVEFHLVLYRARLELQSDSEWTKRHPSFEPHISLVGKYGDSGRRMLPIIQQVYLTASEQEGISLFEAEIEAVYLGDLNRCLLGPVDVTPQLDGERIRILCTGVTVLDPSTEKTYYFHANTWLLGERAGQIHEVHLQVAEIRPAASEEHVDPEPSPHEEEDDEDLVNLIYEDAHQIITAIMDKAEQNLAIYEQRKNH